MMNQELEHLAMLEAKLDMRMPELKASKAKAISESRQVDKEKMGICHPVEVIKMLRDQNTETLSKDFADLARILHRIGFTEKSITMIYDELLVINEKKKEVKEDD